MHQHCIRMARGQTCEFDMLRRKQGGEPFEKYIRANTCKPYENACARIITGYMRPFIFNFQMPPSRPFL
jgi:hypothetical protein